MVRILVLLTCVIEGVSYNNLLNLIRSLPNCNEDFGFDFDACSTARGTEANQPRLRLPSGASTPDPLSAYSASGR